MSLSKIYYNDQSVGLPKWQIALAVTGTIAISAGVYYYFSKESDTSTKKKTLKPRNITESISEDCLPVYDENLSLLKNSQICKEKGNIYFKEGKFDTAIKCYDKAITVCPNVNKVDLSTFYQNRAAAFEQLKNWENVMRDCTAALELNNRYVKALQRRAKACEVLKDLEQALEDLTGVCIIESFQNQLTLVNVDRVLKDLGLQHAKEAIETRLPLSPSKHFIRSYFDSFVEDPIFNSLYKEKEGDVDESEQPPGKNSSNNGYLLAKKNLREGNYEDILDCCTSELANPLTPYKSESLLLRGTIYILRGQNKEAVADLSELINLEDAPVKIKVNGLIKRGTLYMQQENVELCLKDFDKASVQDPNNSDVFHHMGQINLLIGNIDGAISNFKKAVDLNDNFPIAVVQRCYTDYRYAQQEKDLVKVEQIVIEFEEAIKNFPKCVECYILYAQVLSDQRKFEKAEETYMKAIEVDPENPTNYVHRALLCLQWNGDLNKARDLINTALQLDDQCELAYENLATIEVQMGNLKAGVELFDKAIPLARTEMEMAHLFSLRDAAAAQKRVVEKMGITMPHV